MKRYVAVSEDRAGKMYWFGPYKFKLYAYIAGFLGTEPAYGFEVMTEDEHTQRIAETVEKCKHVYVCRECGLPLKQCREGGK